MKSKEMRVVEAKMKRGIPRWNEGTNYFQSFEKINEDISISV